MGKDVFDLKFEMPCRQLLQQVLPVNRSYPANIKRSLLRKISQEKNLSHRKMMVMNAITRSMRKLMVT